MMLPAKFGQKPEDWREWRDSFGDYCDNTEPGLKARLVQARETVQTVEVGWANNIDIARAHDQHIYIIMKMLTCNEAKRVLCSGSHESGFIAWQLLARHFEPALAVREAPGSGLTGPWSRRSRHS